MNAWFGLSTAIGQWINENQNKTIALMYKCVSFPAQMNTTVSTTKHIHSELCICVA